MVYKDFIYGSVEIADPVIIELINHSSFQRLKKIDQTGYPAPFFPGRKRVRFEHSMGVYILLKIFNASIEEQISGLLHDLSHTAFSHCIDFVINEGSGENQDFQDRVFKKFVRESGILAILKKFHFDPEYVLEEKNFTLRERSLPDICADRIDYSLRDSVGLGYKNPVFVKEVLKNLSTQDSHFVFKSFIAAKKFTQFFFKMNQKFYCDFRSALMFQTVKDYLKHAFEVGYVNIEDFFKTDEEVVIKINKNLRNDHRLIILWERMNNKSKIINSPNEFDTHIVIKSRVIDPIFLEKSKIMRFSERETEWKNIMQKESKPKEYFLKFETKM